MKKYFYWSFVLIFFVSFLSHAQVIVENDRSTEGFAQNIYGLGVSAGPISGVGISFRNHFPSKFSFQATAVVMRYKNDQDTLRTFFSFGTEVQYDLVRGQTTRFYFFPGFSYFYDGSDGNTYQSPFRFGAGIGGEFKIQETLHVALEGAFTFYNDGTIIPMPQVSVHYYFY